MKLIYLFIIASYCLGSSTSYGSEIRYIQTTTKNYQVTINDIHSLSGIELLQSLNNIKESIKVVSQEFPTVSCDVATTPLPNSLMGAKLRLWISCKQTAAANLHQPFQFDATFHHLLINTTLEISGYQVSLVPGMILGPLGVIIGSNGQENSTESINF